MEREAAFEVYKRERGKDCAKKGTAIDTELTEDVAHAFSTRFTGYVL